jgi:hypothetical protein
MAASKKPAAKTPAKKTPAKKTQPPAPAKPRIQPRHQILGIEAGMPGYRRGCRCIPCRGANTERVRQYRNTKQAPKAQASAKTAAPPPTSPPSVMIAQLKPGAISKALELDLKKADGAYTFQATVSEMLRLSAKVLDNVDVLERFDLISPMQIRILNGLKRLEPPRRPGDGEEDAVEKIIATITAGDSTQP